MYAYLIAALAVVAMVGGASYKAYNLGADHIRAEYAQAAIVSVLTNLGAVAGIAVLNPWELVPIQSAIVMGLFQGFSVDSALNKNARPIWTAEQRANNKKGDSNGTHAGP